MPLRRRRRSGSRTRGDRAGSGPSDSKPPALRRITRDRRSFVRSGGGSSSSSSTTSSSSGGGGSRSKASEGASQSVPRSVSPSSSSSIPIEPRSDRSSDSGYDSYIDSEFELDFDTDDDGHRPTFQHNERGQLIASIAEKLGYFGQMLLLFETPSGFALFSFSGIQCYLPDSVNNIWAKFADLDRAYLVVYPKGFISFKDKSSAINADTGVDKQLVDLINKWHRPGMKLCVGKPEYKAIIKSKLKIPCKCCQTVMEIMWGIQHQMRGLLPEEKSELTKVDRLPMSQGLKKFLSHYGFDVKPEMVNEEIVMTACALYDCDVDDERRLKFLRDAGLHIRDISGIACKDWDVLKLAVAVKVICCPKEELTDFREVLPEDVVSKLKGDARKYKGIAVKVNWLSTYREVASNHCTRIAKKKILGSLVKKAKKAYEAEQAQVCDKGKLKGESEHTLQDHVTSISNPSTSLVSEVVRRSPRLNPKLYANIGGYKHAWLQGTPSKRSKYSCTPGTMAMDD